MVTLRSCSTLFTKVRDGPTDRAGNRRDRMKAVTTDGSSIRPRAPRGEAAAVAAWEKVPERLREVNGRNFSPMGKVC